MKKILFNDKFGLTQAVLDGRKTQTRRILGYENYTQRYIEKIAVSDAKYKLGEVVAVAMSYKTVVEHLAKKTCDVAKWLDSHNITSNLAGWLNKMFVLAGLMPYRVRITNVRVERLRDISDEDCLAEGIIKEWHAPACRNYYYIPNVVVKRKDDVYDTPREAYAALIDKISGKGTWDSDPYVFVYDFELVKE